MHKHHIVPKHAGGTNNPENLIELTVEEHAEAHRILYEENGCLVVIHYFGYILWNINSVIYSHIIKLASDYRIGNANCLLTV